MSRSLTDAIANWIEDFLDEHPDADWFDGYDAYIADCVEAHRQQDKTKRTEQDKRP